MFPGAGEGVRAAVAIMLILLLCGCLEEKTPGKEERTGDNVIKYAVSECKNITYESTECWGEKFNYSAEPLKKLEPYKMDIFCIGGGSLAVKNLEKEGGAFRVTFTFRTELEGKVVKSVEREIGPKATEVFEEKTQFRCSQEYGASAEVSAPAKQTCRIVNKTREECMVK
jgi:hypothetical protein